jgi:20S proteasome subunit alpha 7
MSTGYDTSCTTLSQEGRIYQIEYANKAIESRPTVLGIILKDGVVLISEKIKESRTIVSGSNPTVYSVAPHIGMAICGILPDGRNIVSRAKLEASSYLKNYGIPISGQILAERLSIYIHAHTCHWGARPFGCCVFISSYDTDKKYHLYMIENTGNFFEYYSCANGKGRQIVKANLEKDNFAIRENNIQDGLKKVLKIIIKSYEGEKETEYDVGIISVGSNNNHSVIDHNIIATEVNKLKDEVKNEKMDIEKEK